MSDYPMNIWILDEKDFDRFTMTGGKIIYIAEEVEPKYATHPAIVSAGALLPPVESISAELDGRMFEAVSMYEQYLYGTEADPFISIIIAAGIKQIPIGIMFGKDERNMNFPKMFINFMHEKYGLVFGVPNVLQPYIIEGFLPLLLAKLYSMNIIDYPTFMEKHPDLPIDVNIIPRLVYDIRPLVKEKNMENFVEYFESVKKSIIENSRKFLIDPLEGI